MEVTDRIFSTAVDASWEFDTVTVAGPDDLKVLGERFRVQPGGAICPGDDARDLCDGRKRKCSGAWDKVLQGRPRAPDARRPTCQPPVVSCGIEPPCRVEA